MKIKELLNDIKSAKRAYEFDNFAVTIFGSARFDEQNIYYQKTYELCKRLAKNNIAIITGGGGGIMEAANKGAKDGGISPNIGINVILPNEQKINSYVKTGVTFSNLAARKVALIERANSFVIMPGGFGTLDELFEVLVLSQVGFKKAKVYLYDISFWQPLVEFLKLSLLEQNTIQSSDLSLFTLSDSIDEIFDDIILNQI